eukprot:tig00022075_g23604.t1
MGGDEAGPSQKRAAAPSDAGDKARIRAKKRKYFQGMQKCDLHSGPGLSGVLITTEQKRERDAAREAVTVFSELLEEGAPEREDAGEEEDVAGALESELAQLKSKEQNPVTAVDLETKGILFLRIINANPLDLIKRLIDNVKSTGVAPSRHCIRFIPIMATCYASADDIGKHAQRVLQPYLLDESIPMKKYCILFSRRNNNTCSREKSMEAIEAHIGGRHLVDLRDPDIVIFLEVFKATCAIGVGVDYFSSAKYNLRTLAERSKAK